MTPPTWTCTACAVTAFYAPGSERSGPPAGWTRKADAWHCLACRREAVVERALREAEVEGSTHTAAWLKRRALADFELRRNPDRRDKAIGNLIGQPANAITEVRRELLAAGAIKPRSQEAANRRPTKPTPNRRRSTPARFAELHARIDAALRRAPTDTDAAIAKALDCSTWPVVRRRRRLEAAGEIARTERRGFASRPKGST
jgi:hypothetical protein